MSSEPLIDAIPLWKRPQDGAIITGWDYPSCEAIGLLKMDFLGLRNLTIIGDALENIKANRGIDLDLDIAAARRSGRPTNCSAAATLSACSSSTAGRCATCCAACSRPASRTSSP